MFVDNQNGRNLRGKFINIQPEKLTEELIWKIRVILKMDCQGRTATEVLEIARDVARKLIEAKMQYYGDLNLAVIADSFDHCWM